MSEVSHATVAADDAGLRLDRWFRREYPGLAYGHLQKLLRSGQIRLDGRRAKASIRLEPGQSIRIPPMASAHGLTAVSPPRDPEVRLSAREAQDLQAAVLYRDDCLIALNKPPGLAVQGGSGQKRHIDGMLDALRFEKTERPRLVHRLDRDTSGVLLLARDAAAARALTAGFRGKATSKIYWALVAGRPPRRRGRIDLPLAKKMRRGSEKVEADTAAGRSATTLYQVVARSGKKASWLLLMPLTGRTHQLRVHCAHLGMPILGDGKYGGKAAFLERPQLPRQLMLLARELALLHPIDGTTLRIQAPLPPHMAEAWRMLGFDPDQGDAASHDFLSYVQGMAGL